MRIVISGIPIDIQKKNIKNMHLQIKPPDGHVVISAPLSMDDKAIEVYARNHNSHLLIFLLLLNNLIQTFNLCIIIENCKQRSLDSSFLD